MVSIKENIYLRQFTVYKIGGPARYFAETKSAEDVAEAARFAREQKVPFIIIGAGSNMLVSDKGFYGLAIHIASGNIEVKEKKIILDAGVTMARAALAASRAGLEGLEWGVGIPGTVGGSVRGNAGCFGGEMKDVVERVEIYDSREATSYQLPAVGCDFSYRHSIFKERQEWIILSVTCVLKKGDAKAIQQNIRRITETRSEKQDIGTKSCGCIFKNVSWARKDMDKEKLIARFPLFAEFRAADNLPASFLIDRAELKGKRIGRVYVSSKHANYFVNEGGAGAEEVVMLISLVKDTVRRKFGILLEEEIQHVGF